MKLFLLMHEFTISYYSQIFPSLDSPSHMSLSRESLLHYHARLLVILALCGTTMMNQWKERREQCYTSLKLLMQHLVHTSVA